MNTDYSGYNSRNNGRRASYPLNNNKNSLTLDGDTIPIKKQYFDFIATGKKTVEGRIYTYPFTKATKGDVVTFINQTQKVTCRITEIVKYKSFKDMLDQEGVRNCLPEISTVDEGVKIYHAIPGYEDKAKKHGVIAIRIEKFTKDQFKTTSSYEVTLPTVKTHSPAAPSSSSNAQASEKLRARSEDYKKEDERKSHERRSENRSEHNYYSHESSRTRSPDRKRDDRRDSYKRYEDDRRSKDYHSNSSDRRDKYRSERDYERDKSYYSRSSERKDSSSHYKADAHDHSSKKRKRERDEESSSDAEHKHKKQKTED